MGRSVDMRGLWRRHLDAAAGAREQLTVGEYRKQRFVGTPVQRFGQECNMQQDPALWRWGLRQWFRQVQAALRRNTLHPVCCGCLLPKIGIRSLYMC